MKKAWKYPLYFIGGGIAYYLLEYSFRTILHRGDTHWTMFVIGGFSLMAILLIDDRLRFPLWVKAILSGLAITAMEFLLGGFYLYVLHDPIWTYGTAAILEVISVTWSMLWCALSLLVLLIRRLFLRVIGRNKKER